MTAAVPTVAVDDERVRVTTWSFADGAETGDHVHEYDYVVVPVTGGTFTVANADGSFREMTQEAGVAYRGTAGTAHNVINGSGRPAVFTEIELKS